MGIFSKLFGGEAPAIFIDYNKLIDDLIAQTPLELTQIGNSKPQCPYCDTPLSKMPKRTIKCPSCGNKIHLGTRPYDGRRVLATSQQFEEIKSEQWRQSDAYREKIEMLKRNLLRYQESGIMGWGVLAVLDESDKPEFVRFHGKLFRFGSKGEIDALKLMVRPDSRCCLIPFSDDPNLDADLSMYKKERDKWLEERGFSR